MSLLITSLGLLGMALMTLSYACKNDNTLRIISIAGLVVWMTHFSLMEVWSIVSMMFVGLLILVAMIFNKKRLALVMLGALSLALPYSLYLWIAGSTTWDYPFAIATTIILNGALVLLAGHAMSLALGSALLMNAFLSFAVGSIPSGITNLVNFTGLLARTAKLIKAEKSFEMPS